MSAAGAGAADEPGPAVLAIRGLRKSFTGQRAVDDVSLRLRAGEIRALVGKNGCGKSTLIKVLAGFHLPDAGQVTLDGRPLSFGDAEGAEAAGLRFVHQDLGLVGTLDAVDNLALGRGYRHVRGGRISWRRERRDAEQALRDLGYTIDLTVPVARLTMSERTAIAIARAVSDRRAAARVLVLDEPTANMPADEVARLFELIRSLRAGGMAVLYVSHHLQEIFELADTVTVMRDGRHVATRPMAGLDEDQLVELMIGRRLAAAPPVSAAERAIGDTLISVRDLRTDVLRSVDLDVHAGEVVGVTGITGSGREQLAMALFGGVFRKGTVTVGGRVVAAGRPDLSVAAGMGFVPSDRHANAALLEAPLRENLTLVDVRPAVSRGVLRKGRERADVQVWLERLSIDPPEPERPMGKLSGGNQQKVVLARWLRQSPRVLVLDDPTQGVDVGAKSEIHAIVGQLAARGTGVLLVSSDEAELAGVCDRVLVLSGGRVSRELRGPGLSPDDVSAATLAAVGGPGRAAQTEAAGPAETTGPAAEAGPTAEGRSQS
jgi:ribose transport system ATP-binding protein